MPDSSTAIIIVDHGSKRSESNDMLEQFVDQYRAFSKHTIVEPAHMELAEPTIMTMTSAVATCTDLLAGQRNNCPATSAMTFISRTTTIESMLRAELSRHPRSLPYGTVFVAGFARIQLHQKELCADSSELLRVQLQK